jgi:S-DNA-T family DNA segregation ATPase FtsK/SpoIIIE
MPIKKPSRSSRSSKSKTKAKPSRAKTSRGNATSSKPTNRRRSAAPPAPPRATLSPERRLDLIGIVMAVIGLITLLSLISSNRSALTGGWVHIVSLLFGWGVYILPIALLVVGAWLVFRNLESIPPFSVERATGFVLLFIWLQVALHVIAGSPSQSSAIADAGKGGGYVGSIFVNLLWAGLGSGGAIVALIAWLLIALTMTLDLSIPELFQFFGPILTRTRQALSEFRTSKTSELNHPATPPVPAPEAHANGFTPLERTSEPPQVLPEAAADFTQPRTVTSAPSIVWSLPSVKNILDLGSAPTINEEFIEQRARLIEDTLGSFGAPAQVIEINRGPTITQFGVEPLFVETRTGRTRVRVSKIASLADDLALALAAPRIRIQAPVPGRGYVGIEVPNEEMTLVSLRDIMESDIFQRKASPLRFALGRDVAGHPVTADLTSMPHLLIAGTTGSGKSVLVNSILTCMLLRNAPDDIRLVLVDPKRVELTSYNGIPHLLAPVVVEMERVIGALQWMTREMDKRYHEFAQRGARNIEDYNIRMKLQGGKKLPYLVIVIDELADLMMIAPDETERTITRLAQLARATGIHMILATQRPSVDVVTGLIKANFPARVAFAVASGVDSRVILDQPGAERLLGRGDMLYQAPDAPAPVRLQGVFVSDYEIQRLVEFWHQQAAQYNPYAMPGASSGGPPVDALPEHVPLKQVPMWEEMKPEEPQDPLLDEAIDLVRREGRASISMLQRKLRIGYTRAARLVDTMEDRGIVGPPEGGTQVRQVLDYGPAAPPKED